MTETQAPYFNPQPKPTRYENKKYRAFVRSHPCMNPKCGAAPPNHAHHVDAVDGTGIGTKPNDLYQVPLCWKCHRLLEDGLLMIEKEDLLRAICRLLAEAVVKGIFEKGRT